MYIFVILALSCTGDMIIHSEDMVSFLFHMLFQNKPQYVCIIYAQNRTNVNRYCAIHQDMLAISIDRSVAMCALAPNPCSSTITNVITSMCLQKSFHAPKISPRFGLQFSRFTCLFRTDFKHASIAQFRCFLLHRAIA